ncbi:hypothetical protein [Metallibacterium scheffleri]|uniref:hypothetical protein n=1 Tax=Metallibacterium scheffleri TaxID=993689 RepID=UPI0023F00390|nr:hypothetical protein [Metallibacterium scheffleri]
MAWSRRRRGRPLAGGAEAIQAAIIEVDATGTNVTRAAVREALKRAGHSADNKAIRRALAARKLGENIIETLSSKLRNSREAMR